jgi:uncharacterized GH25 family protein
VTIRFATFVGRAAARPVVLAAALLLAAGDLCAHDFWIEPSTFHPPPGSTVAVGLRVGQNFVGDPVPRIASSIEQFVIRQAGTEETVNGLQNIDPAGWLRADGQSTAVIVYCSTGSFVELPAEKFEDYLRQEGLERIVESRARRGQHDKPGRERFYRYAKALLAGERPSAEVSRPLGLVYEIVPDDDPTTPRDRVGGRVLYQGKPLPEALVVAMLQGDPSTRLTTRSDARGAFSFQLPHAGVWLIKSVHMVKASFFSDADWDSLWASLTFETPAARP